MFKLFLNNFKTTNNNIILAVPLVIFYTFISWYFSIASKMEHTLLLVISTYTTAIVLIAAFISIWFYITKKVIKLSTRDFVYDKDRIKALNNTIKEIPKGFGKYFLPCISVVTFAMLIFIAGYNYIEQASLLKLINIIERMHLSDSERSIFVFLTISFFSFWGILWIPEIFYSEKNPYKALVYSIKKVFLTFPQTLVMYLYIYILFIIVQYAITFLIANPFMYFIVLLLYYYLSIYITVLLFSYYEQKFLKPQN